MKSESVPLIVLNIPLPGLVGMKLLKSVTFYVYIYISKKEKRKEKKEKKGEKKELNKKRI